MNVNLDLLCHRLNELTEDYPAVQIINELHLVSERIAFAGSYTAQSEENTSLQGNVEYILGADVSPQVLEFIRYLIANSLLVILSGNAKQAFFNYCNQYFSRINQITITSAVDIGTPSKLEFRRLLKTSRTTSSRVMFNTDPSLLAGFIIEDTGEKHDFSLRSQAVNTIEDFVRKQTSQPSWMK